MHATLAADAIDRHDVRMLQARRRAGLVVEALQVARVHGGGEGQHLEGDAPAQADLLGLVDHPHAAAAHLPQNLVVPQLP